MQKKICFILPTLRKGGLEKVASILANNFITHSHVVIITLVNDKVENVLNENIKIIHLNSKETFNKFYVLIKLIRVIRNINPDVIIGFSEVFNPISVLAAKLTGKNVFISDRSNPFKILPFRDRILKKITYPFANGIIAQTSIAKKRIFEKKLNNNIEIIANPLSSISNTNLNFNKKKIVTLGRLVKSKNHIELIKIFHEINNKDWHLIIGGEGPEKDNLEEYITKNNLTDSVTLVGLVNDLELFLSQGSIFAFTSLSEGFPNALLEGLAYPLATIAYDCPTGVSDLITHKVNGFLIPLNERDLYKQHLIELMNSDRLRNDFMAESFLLRDMYLQSTISEKYFTFITTV